MPYPAPLFCFSRRPHCGHSPFLVTPPPRSRAHRRNGIIHPCQTSIPLAAYTPILLTPCYYVATAHCNLLFTISRFKLLSSFVTFDARLLVRTSRPTHVGSQRSVCSMSTASSAVPYLTAHPLVLVMMSIVRVRSVGGIVQSIRASFECSSSRVPDLIHPPVRPTTTPVYPAPLVCAPPGIHPLSRVAQPLPHVLPYHRVFLVSAFSDPGAPDAFILHPMQLWRSFYPIRFA